MNDIIGACELPSLPFVGHSDSTAECESSQSLLRDDPGCGEVVRSSCASLYRALEAMGTCDGNYRLTAVDVLSNADALMKLVKHKLDLLRRSNSLILDKLPEMCHASISNINLQARTNINLQSGSNLKHSSSVCICHKHCCPAAERMTRMNHGIRDKSCKLNSYQARWSIQNIMQTFCDLESCSVCCDLACRFCSQDLTSQTLGGIFDVNSDILLEGGVHLTGSYDVLFISIFSSASVWSKIKKSVVRELSTLLLFLMRAHRSQECVFVLDARRSKRQLLKSFMDSLHAVNRRAPENMATARVLIDRPSQTGTIVGSIDKRSGLQVDILTSAECLNKFTDTDYLPLTLGGKSEFDARRYIDYHHELHQNVSKLHGTIEQVLYTTHSLSRVPKTLSNCSQIARDDNSTLSWLSNDQTSLNGYNGHVKTGDSQPDQYCTLPNLPRKNCESISTARPTPAVRPTPAARPTLAQLLLTSPETKQVLDGLERLTRGTEIYRGMMESLSTLSRITLDVQALKSLAKERLEKLYGCEKIWSYIEQITKNLTLQRKAHEWLNQIRSPSSNLKSAQFQQSKLTRAEPQIKKLLREGNQVLADVLDVVCRTSSPITWLEQLVTKLKTELEFLTTLLNKTRHCVESTYCCYRTLDEAYNWAVDAMKLVSQDHMENCMSDEALELLATRLKSFIDHNTYIDDTRFDEISREARFLSNRKLAEQCKTAKRRCIDATKLLHSKYLEVEKRLEQENLLLNHISTSTLDNELEKSSTSSSSHDRSSIFDQLLPLNTQSAPATPALGLRSTGQAEMKRRSQSMEDDIANKIYQYIERRMEECDEPLAAAEGDLEASPLAERKADEAEEFFECKSNMDDQTDDERDKPNFSQNLNGEDEVDNIGASMHTTSLSEEYFGTVDRSDKFLDVNHDITIPFDDDFYHLNNNSLKLQSPSLESGEIITYTPGSSDKNGASVLAAQSSHSNKYMQASIDFDQEEQNPSESVAETFVPRVRFDDRVPVDQDSDSKEQIHQSDSLLSTTAMEAEFKQDRHCQVSPVMSSKQKKTAMEKRRSFHGFTSLVQPFANFARSFKNTEDNIKRLSVSSNVSEQLEDSDESNQNLLAGTMTSSQSSPSNLIESSLRDKETSRLLKSKRLESKTMSLVTASTDSLPSLPEEYIVDSSTLPRERSKSSSRHPWSPIPVNSHLMNKRVLPSTRSTSMADLRLTESEIKSRVTLAHIMDELIQTEQDYVESLKLVVEHYMPELSRDDVPQALRGKRGVIFGNIEKIYDFHKHHFLSALAACENVPFKISQCFLSHEGKFLMYALYNKNKPKSDRLMAEHGAAFFKEQQYLMGDKMDLSSYLLKPVQRMGKYALIIKQILKECPDTITDHQELEQAEEMIRFCLQHGNDLLAMDALEDCDVNLQEQGTLLLQGEFIVTKNRRKSSRHVFLFEQLLVLSKTKKLGAGRDQYIYKTGLKTSDLGLTENVGASGLKFEIWFRKRGGDSWTFQAGTAQIKNRWVQTIEKLLWTQAVKNRESKLMELSTMGVGNKPCLDLKRSENNIYDRFVPSSSNSSNFTKEESENIKKRPHSIISLAASSSSNSSSGSNGMANARQSTSWLELKAAGRSGEHNSYTSRLKKLYKSDSKIQRCDSGISSLSDGGNSMLAHTIQPIAVLDMNRLGSKIPVGETN